MSTEVRLHEPDPRQEARCLTGEPQITIGLRCGLLVHLALVLASSVRANLTERRENRYLQSRTKTRIDEGWKVNAGGDPAGAKDAPFNDESWATTNVPHDRVIALVGKTTDIDPGNNDWYQALHPACRCRRQAHQGRVPRRPSLLLNGDDA